MPAAKVAVVVASYTLLIAGVAFKLKVMGLTATLLLTVAIVTLTASVLLRIILPE
ncbi:hypothetical protein D9M68_671430 [compost metagenome]